MEIKISREGYFCPITFQLVLANRNQTEFDVSQCALLAMVGVSGNTCNEIQYTAVTVFCSLINVSS